MESSAVDIASLQLLLGYILLVIPITIFLVYRIRVLKEFAVSILRMTIQLLLVGFYLQFVFDLNLWWLNVLWLVFMLGAADFSLLSASGINLRRFSAPVFVSLLAGTGVPLIYFLAIILQIPNVLDAQYFIPIAGIIMGNSMRANIVGMRSFYTSLHTEKPAYLYALSQGASLKEAVAPFFRNAFGILDKAILR
jgi:putative ABC transport system permease protein